MKELGMVLFGCMCFVGFFSTMIYPELEYKGYSSTHSCTGECYEEYVKTHGSVVEQLIAKRPLDMRMNINQFEKKFKIKLKSLNSEVNLISKQYKASCKKY